MAYEPSDSEIEAADALSEQIVERIREFNTNDLTKVRLWAKITDILIKGRIANPRHLLEHVSRVAEFELIVMEKHWNA